MDIAAVIVACGVSGPIDALTPVAGVPMVTRAVRAVLAGLSLARPSFAELSTVGSADRVVVLAPGDRHDAVATACAGLPVEVRESLAPRAQPLWAHVGQRATPAPGDGPGGLPVALVHEAVRPLTPPALVAAVVAAAGAVGAVGCDAVVPVLPLTDTVKLVDAHGLVTATPDRAGLRVLQTPQAVRADLLRPGRDPLAGLAARAAVRTVDGDPLAFPVHTGWDLELAELLVAEADR